jgi:phosphoribosylformylglycinamidine synthase
MQIGIVRFPGTNNEKESITALKSIKNINPILIASTNPENLSKCDGVLLAGGFSYGDYLRTGVIAASNKILEIIKEMNNDNKPIIGICNGFQILTEAKILDGVLMRNQKTRFISKWVYLKVASRNSFFSKNITKNVLKIPIAHNEGRFFHTNVSSLFDEDRVIFQYADINGTVSNETNPNGSLENIAGVTNKARNVVGLMPHPERASFKMLGSIDGIEILKHFVNRYV